MWEPVWSADTHSLHTHTRKHKDTDILHVVEEEEEEEGPFSDVYIFSPNRAPYFRMIKLFSGTNYNYALLKIIKNSHQASHL